MNVKTAIITIASITYAVLLIMFSQAVSESVKNAVNLCLTVIIPSLFAFMVICDFLVKSNAYTLLSKPFSWLSKHILRINPDLFSVVLLSSFAGYPIGAKLLDSLYRQHKIDKQTATDMLCYCYAGGPAFISGVVAMRIYGDARAGIIIFSSILLSNMLIAVLIGVKRRHTLIEHKQTSPEITADVSDFISSVISGAKGMFIICVMIVFFSSVTAVLEKLGLFAVFTGDNAVLARGFLEISNIGNVSYGRWDLLPIIAALLSFGGVCVVLQVKAILHKDILLKSFYFSRILSTLSSYFCCKIVIGLFLNEQTVQTAYNIGTVTVAERNISPVPALFLVVMTALLLSDKAFDN